MKIYKTPKNAKPFPGKSFTGESMTEQSGYIPTKKKIQMFMHAGRVLAASRAEQFDVPPGQDNVDLDSIPVSVSRLKSADIVDVHNEARETHERMTETAKTVVENAEKEAETAALTAEKELKETSISSENEDKNSEPAPK